MTVDAPAPRADLPAAQARWAPWTVLACLSLWPWVAPANVAVALTAVLTIGWLGLRRFRGGDGLLSREAWALTTALFFSYWLPELFACIGAADARRALVEVLTGLRFLPLLWLAAIAVHRERERRIVFVGIAVLALFWTGDGLVQALTGHGLRGAANIEAGSGLVRISGIFGAQHPHLGQALASLAVFPLGWVAPRAGRAGWLGVALLLGLVIVLSGSRAAVLTYALVLLFSSWRRLDWKQLLGVLVAAVVGIAALATVFPAELHSRIARSQAIWHGGIDGLDAASSGRVRIWGAALCMAREHPLNGVGVRGYRDAYAHCAPHMDTPAPWGDGSALHAHQIVLEVLSETGLIGLALWLIGAALAIRAWRFAKPAARARAALPAVALAVTVFPINTHLAFYSSFWGGFTLLLAGLYVGALFGEDATIDTAGER